MSVSKAVAVALVALGLAACGGGSYYKVTDPGNGKDYYTEDVKRSGPAVMFKDAQTGAETTLQNSQVLEIDKRTFEAAVGKK